MGGSAGWAALSQLAASWKLWNGAVEGTADDAWAPRQFRGAQQLPTALHSTYAADECSRADFYTPWFTTETTP